MSPGGRAQQPKIELQSLADAVGPSATAPLPTSNEESLELDWDSAGGRPPPGAAARPQRRRPEFQVVDWQEERRAAREVFHGERGVRTVKRVAVGLLALRLAMSMTGAFEASTFSRVVYEISHVMAKPFARVLDDVPLADGRVLETSVLGALCAYYLLGSVIGSLLKR